MSVKESAKVFAIHVGDGKCDGSNGGKILVGNSEVIIMMIMKL